MANKKTGHVKKAKRIVRDKFPEMAGVEPSLSKKRAHGKALGPKSGSSAGSEGVGHYVLTFEKDVSLPGGRRLKRLVRVTMNESGEVVKLTSSK